MTKKPLEKSEEKQIVKALSEEEAINFAISCFRDGNSVAGQVKELAREQLPEKKPFDDIIKNLDSISLAYSLESGYALMESVDDRYRKLALQMKWDLEKEYKCDSSSEKALADQIVSSYIRKLSFSKLLESCKKQEYCSNEKVGYLKFLSKEIDRSYRQFLSALETLKAIKQPALNVNIKAQNTFFAQNQQINNPSEKINEDT